MGIERVGIVGGGQMGGGIAEVCAKAGVDTIIVEINDDLVARSKAGIEKSLGKAVDRSKLDADAREAALSLLTFSTDRGSLADRDLVIEAVIENEDLKHDIFNDLDRIVSSPEAILATNTSSIPVTRIAQATSRPESVVGMHFFNPATIMPLVEIVRTVVVSDDAVDRASAFASERLVRPWSTRRTGPASS